MSFVSTLKIGLPEMRYNPQIVLNFLGITNIQTENTCMKELISLFLGSSMAYLSTSVLDNMLHF